MCHLQVRSEHEVTASGCWGDLRKTVRLTLLGMIGVYSWSGERMLIIPRMENSRLSCFSFVIVFVRESYFHLFHVSFVSSVYASIARECKSREYSPSTWSLVEWTAGCSRQWSRTSCCDVIM